jgi:bifunctional non-homologous end joining protein LigD
VAFDDEGQPSFAVLQQLVAQASRRRRAPVVLFCFDLLHIAGVNTRGQSYSERRGMLEQAVKESEHLRLVHSEPNGHALFDAAAAMDMEGLVAKRRSSTYQAGVRSSDWLKILAFKRADFLVLGYKGTERVDALLVGYRRAGRLIYAGEVTGLRGLAQSLLPVLQTVPPAPPCARIPGAKSPRSINVVNFSI